MKQLQIDTHTSIDRYPFVFKDGANYLSTIKNFEDMRILSYGCSNGDELLTLANYFPGAKLYGCDINESMLNEARNKLGDKAIVFKSDISAIKEHGPYDFVACMSVLCLHGTNANLILSELPFSLFESVLLSLTEVVSDNGILALFNTSYFPHESSIFFNQFKSLKSPGVPENSHIRRYLSTGELAIDHDYIEGIGCSRLVVEYGRLKDAYLTDCLFVRRGSQIANVKYFEIPNFEVISHQYRVFFPHQSNKEKQLYRSRLEITVSTSDRTLVLGQNIRKSVIDGSNYMMEMYCHG